MPASRESFEEVTAEAPEPDVMLEPTQAMPALRGLLHPTKEMPSGGDRPVVATNRDAGAA